MSTSFIMIQIPTILLIGTGDTKSDEMLFMRDCLQNNGGHALVLDVSVLGNPSFTPDYSKHAVAKAAHMTIEDIVASGDENTAMAHMARGASKLTRQIYDDGKIDGVLILGGSMGTDLALDVAAALPLGVPKFVVSTIAFSHLIPPDRLSTDLMMILWAGGLYGLNSVCQSVLSQACGAVLGAAKAVVKPQFKKPLIGITSLGKSCLNYMVRLKPELEKRGFEVAIFHATGMGGRAFESLCAQKAFVCVFDFCLQEVVNHQMGVMATSSGDDRLENAGRVGIPQIIAPGAIDMVDLPSWQPLPQKWKTRPYHAHNRLLGSITTTAKEREATASLILQKLSKATAPVAYILPNIGIQGWDSEGEPLHNPEGLEAFVNATRKTMPANIAFYDIPHHINDDGFTDKALEIFDDWLQRGFLSSAKA